MGCVAQLEERLGAAASVSILDQEIKTRGRQFEPARNPLRGDDT